jgi:hypothetical protein
VADRDAEILTSAQPADVAQLALIEAVRKVGDGQIRIADTMKMMQQEFREERKVLADVRERVIRIESNKLDRTVEQIREDLDAARDEINTLKMDKARRDGAVGAAEWLSRFGPWLLALAMAILAFAGLRRG